MFKKIMAAILCVLMIGVCVPFTVSAENSASFKICVASQDSKSVVVTLDFAGGTGFSAFDADIEYNNLKLSLEDCQFASGFAAFKQYSDKNNGAMIYDANSNANPVKVSIATTEPFKIINKDGAILKLKFSKIKDANISEDDITLKIENCQTSDFEDIKTSVAYDLTSGSSSSSSDTVIESGKLPEEEAQISEDGILKETTENSVDNTESVLTEKADTSSQEAEQAEEATESNNGLSNSKKTVIIIVIAVICIGCIAGLSVIIIKNKKSSNGIEE